MVYHRLNRRFDVYRRTPAPDGSGGEASIWARVGWVRARVSQPRAVEQVLAEQAGSRQDTNVFLEPKADVRRGDILRDFGAPADSRPYFDVISVIEPSRELYRRAECELVQAEGEA